MEHRITGDVMQALQITLHTLPFSRFANRVAAAMGGSRGESRGLGGLGGNILGDIISD